MASVEPGEQVLCEADFRGMHEYTGGMVMNLYASQWADAPIHQPELAAAFEDHFVLIEQGSVYKAWLDERLGPMGWTSRIVGTTEEPDVVEFTRATG